MFLYAGPSDPTRVFPEEMSSGDLDKALQPLLKYKAKEDLPGKSLTAPLSANKAVPQVKLLVVCSDISSACCLLSVLIIFCISCLQFTGPQGSRDGDLSTEKYTDALDHEEAESESEL